MKKYIVDDKPQSFKLSDIQTIEVSVECKILSVINQILGMNLASEDILLVNINLKLNKHEFRQDHKGLELLTWLRIKGVMNHCILYSFQSIESIARSNENNRIMFSKGTSFVRLPNDFSYLTNEKLLALSKDVANNYDFAKTIKPLFDIGAFRHREANWWGVKQLWDVHKIFTEGKFNEQYPLSVSNNLLNLNNALGNYLFGFGIVSLTQKIDTIEDLTKQIESKYVNQKVSAEGDKNRTEKELDEWNTEVNKLENQIKELKDEITRNQNYFAANRGSYLTIKASIEDKDLELDDTKKVRDTTQIDLETKTEFLENIVTTIFELKKEVYLNEKRKLPSPDFILDFSINSRILVIDDDAENGWVEVYRKLFPKAKIQYHFPTLKYKENIKDYYKKILKRKISEFEPDFLLLDLRLFNEEIRSMDLNSLSGKYLLELIREDFKTTPILITTASNKIWTYQSLLNSGADAFWVKEGVDEQRDFQDSAMNYFRLIFLFNQLADEKYVILEKLSEITTNFENQIATHWANEVKWANGTTTYGDLIGFHNNLKDSVQLLRTYLKDFHLNYQNLNSTNESFFISNLINKIGGVYENIHNLNQKELRNIGKVMRERKDKNSLRLRVMRNRVSHYNYKLKSTWVNLKKTIKLLEKYLYTPPDTNP